MKLYAVIFSNGEMYPDDRIDYIAIVKAKSESAAIELACNAPKYFSLHFEECYELPNTRKESVLFTQEF